MGRTADLKNQFKANYEYGETPTGTINGTNKVFTLANPPVSIIEVYVGGAPYTAWTLSGSTLTLTDAPLTGYTLTVNYIKE